MMLYSCNDVTCASGRQLRAPLIPELLKSALALSSFGSPCPQFFGVPTQKEGFTIPALC